MRKTLLLLSVLLTSLSMFAQENLTTGKQVVPLGGLNDGISSENLQLLTTEGNTTNVFLLPEPSTDGTAIQGFYIDLGASKSIGSIASTWEGADCGANIYVTDTEPAANGTLTGETLIATFTDVQEKTKNATVTVDNSGRYIVFVPTTATNYGWGVKMRTFVVYDKYEAVLTTLNVTADSKTLLVGKTTNLAVTAEDQIGNTMEPGAMTWTSSAPSVGTVADGVFTALAAGTTTITAAVGTVTATVDITVIAAPSDIPALTTTGDITKIYTGEESATGYGWADWGAATKGEGITVNSKGAFMMSDFTYYGSQFEKMDASGATKLHLDVYGLTAGKLTIIPICWNSETSVNEVEKGTEFTLTAGAWNSLDIAIDKIIDEDGVSMKELYQIKYVGSIANKTAKGVTDGFANGEGNSFIIGNVYLVTEEATEDTEAPVMTKAEATSIDATEVTLTVSATDNETRSLTYKVFNGEEEVASSTGAPGEDATVKVTGLTKKTAYTLTVKAVDKAGNTSATGMDVNFTTADLFIPDTNPTEPTLDAADVLAVYSAKYDKGLVDNNSGWGVGGGAPNPLYTKVEEVEIADGHKVVHVNGTGFNNRTKDAVALSDAYSYVYVALYPKTATSCKIFGDNLYAQAISVTGLVPNQWNYVKVANTINSTNYILIELVDETEFYLDHFYFKKMTSDECVISVPNAQDIVTVKGTITNENKSEVEALTDAMIDLSSATITATSLAITGNPNAVVVVEGAVEGNVATTTQTAVTGNRVVKSEGYYFPVEQLQFVDDPKNGLWTGFFISGNAAGWKYTRTLKANTYNTVVVPVGTTVPEGATAYQLSAYADGTVTFNEINGAMAAGEPYLVKVGGADVTIEVESNNDFNIVVANEKATEKDGATFKANYKKQEMSDVYVLETGTTSATFKKAASANIGSCRAYLTGVAPASSLSHELTIVFNGETTNIGTIRADGTIDVENTVIYDLSGRRVKNPTKGIYIVNGKKVIIK